MTQFLPALIALPLVLFWLWMFVDMANNDDLPNNSTQAIKWPPTTKFEWTLAFIFLSLLAAGYYFFTVFRDER